MLKQFLILLGCGWALAVTAQEMDRIWVDGQINGQKVRLIYDTGMSNPFLFKPSADRLKLKVEAPPANAQIGPGEVLCSRTEPVDFTFLKFAMRAPFPVLDVPDYFRLTLSDSTGDGALSLHAIPAKVYAFDMFSKKLDFSDTVPPEALNWQKFEQTTNTPMLCFQAGAQDPELGPVLVDTGSPDGVSLCHSLWAKFLAENGRQPATMTAFYNPGAGMVVKPQMWAKEVVIGALSLKDVPVDEITEAQEKAAAGRKYAAHLGLFALRKMNLVLDDSAHVVYVRTHERPFLAFQHNRLGAKFVPSNPKEDALIARVIEGGPAYEAGIRDGDALLKINGEDLTHWRAQSDLPNTRFTTSPPGATFDLILKRDGREYQAKPVLRSLIGPGSAASIADDAATIRARAEQGDAQAQVKLGRLYQAGTGVAKDEWKR